MHHYLEGGGEYITSLRQVQSRGTCTAAMAPVQWDPLCPLLTQQAQALPVIQCRSCDEGEEDSER